MNYTIDEVPSAIDHNHFPKNTLRLIQQAHKRWRGAIEASKTGGCDIRSWMRHLTMQNIRWNQKRANSFDIAEWYGSALAFAEAGLTEEFLAVREAAAREVLREAEEERARRTKLYGKGVPPPPLCSPAPRQKPLDTHAVS